VVPLKEAWESGVGDVGKFNRYRPNHYCMPSSANRSKGSSEPHEWHSKPKFAAWLDANPGQECLLIRQWASVKAGYPMSADSREHAYVSKALADCGSGNVITQESAFSPQATPKPIPTATPKPNPAAKCTHWHKGHPKHSHPGPAHGPHASGKCKGV